MNKLPALLAMIAVLALPGCNDSASKTAPQPTQSSSPKSIFRPEFQKETEPQAHRLEPLRMRVLFQEGAELTDAAIGQLSEALASPQFEAGGAIILRGHSDAGGGDAINLRVSRARAEAVRDWMIENGAAEARITVIAFGEQNPAAPNAKPDGTPDDEGRAANRRVDITIAVAGSRAPREKPSLAETLAEDEEATAGHAPEQKALDLDEPG